MYIELIMWLVTAASLVGTAANIKKRRWCFHVWFWTDLVWVAYDVYKQSYAQAVFMFALAIFAVWGLVEWKKAK